MAKAAKKGNASPAKKTKTAVKKASPKPKSSSSARPKRGGTTPTPKTTPPKMMGRIRVPRIENATSAPKEKAVIEKDDQVLPDESPSQATRSRTNVQASPNLESTKGSGEYNNDDDERDVVPSVASDDDSDDDSNHDSADDSGGSSSEREINLKTDTASTRKRITASGEKKYWMVSTRKLVAA